MNKKIEITSNLKRLNNLPELLNYWATKKPNQKFLFKKDGNKWSGFGFKHIQTNVRKIKSFFIKNGLEKNDRVFLLSANRIEWVEFDLAIMSLGAITVPSFVTNNNSDNDFIIKDSSPKFIILENERVFKQNEDILKKLKKRIIIIEKSDNFLDYKKILLTSKEDISHTKIYPKDISSIIYTSGTTGNPKGVVLTHKSIIHNLRAAKELVNEFNLEKERFLSFLPLSHSYERMAGLYFPMSIGSEIYFCSSMEKLLKEVKEVKPTIFSAVPRLYENIFKKIKSQISKSNFLTSFFLKSVFNYTKINTQKKVINNFIAKLFINLILKKKLNNNFGGRIKVFISGGAALNPEIGYFFNRLGLFLLQGYGQTEASPLISCNRKNSNDPKTVGPPVSGVQIKISLDREILVKGENLMFGYWNNSSLTKKTIKNGWLHTGDLGEIDCNGRLIITGRKKDLIVTSGGDNISSQRIENMILSYSEINHVIVYGDGKPFLIALIFMDKKESKIVKKIINQINEKLNSVEKIRKFLIFEKELSYENGFMTQTLKIKKEKVFDYYKNEISKLY